MKKVLAISGGVDSMVMLCQFLERYEAEDLVVAHFDHGMRENSGEDAAFVEAECARAGVPCRVGRGELGTGTSEAEARGARYKFLRQVAEEVGGEIYTAHHLDDLVETVAINLLRGTGWRGLAAFGGEVRRPFLEPGFGPVGRKEILRYAGEHGVRFREDQSNNSEAYLRNRVRAALEGVDVGEQIYTLWRAQTEIRREVDALVEAMMPEGAWERAWFREMDDAVAIELLRTRVAATRPQLYDLLKAIREYKPGKYFNLPGDRLVRINRGDFTP